MRLVLFPICSVSSQQLDAINPALLLPPSYKEGRACGHSPTKLPLFTENPSRVLLGNRASGIWASRKPSFVLCRYVRTARSVDYTGLSIRTMGILRLTQAFPIRTENRGADPGQGARLIFSHKPLQHSPG